MHRLEYEAPVLAFDIDDALGAQDVLSLLGHQPGEPAAHLGTIHRRARGERDTANVAVVFMIVHMMVLGLMFAVLAMLVVRMTRFAMDGIEEIRLQRNDALDIEAAASQHFVERYVRALRAVDRRERIELSQARFDFAQFLAGHEFRLVEHDLIGEGYLLHRLAAIGEAKENVPGIDHRCYRIEEGPGLQKVVNEECLHHRAGIGEAARLDNDGVEFFSMSARFDSSPCRVRIRSPRTVQQMQPLFISNNSSSAFTIRSLSMPTSPNSLTITA